MRHPDGARRRRRRRLTLDGGLVLSAILVHRRYLRGAKSGKDKSSVYRDEILNVKLVNQPISITAGRTFLLCFLRSLGCRG